MNLSILIASYGEESWARKAMSHALPSAQAQAEEVLVGHDPEGTISSTRNELAAKASGDWLCFLDADDRLAPSYVGAMERALEQERGGHPDTTALLLTPAISYVVQGRPQPAHFQKEVDLKEGNWLTIGTLLPRWLFCEIEGFREYGLYEDWDLWTRCHKAGAEIVKVPEAVYLASYSRESRNRNATRFQRNFWHQRIGHDNWPELYEDTTVDEEFRKALAGVRKRAAAVH